MARDPLPISETEAGFQDAIRHLALLQGWKYFHCYDAQHSTPGFPDIVLVRETSLLLAELKTARGVVMPEQQRWLDALQQVRTVETYLWRPTDFPTIAQRLLRKENSPWP